MDQVDRVLQGLHCMLMRVERLAVQAGWLDAQRPLERTFYLSQGAQQTLLFSRDGEPVTFIRFAFDIDLSADAQRAAAASRQYPDHAPHYRGWIRDGDLQLIATAAVDATPLTAASSLRGAQHTRMNHGLVNFFERMRALTTATATIDSGSRQETMRALHAFAGSIPANACVAEGLRRLEEVLPSLPSAQQHGDLVLNNLALERSGRLVVFDWEDFGSLDVPGLDVFTVEFSLLDGTHPRWLTQCDVATVTPWCLALGLDLQRYLWLRPSYLLLFRYLKRNYGRAIQQRLDALMSRMALGLEVRS